MNSDKLKENKIARLCTSNASSLSNKSKSDGKFANLKSLVRRSIRTLHQKHRYHHSCQRSRFSVEQQLNSITSRTNQKLDMLKSSHIPQPTATSTMKPSSSLTKSASKPKPDIQTNLTLTDTKAVKSTNLIPIRPAMVQTIKTNLINKFNTPNPAKVSKPVTFNSARATNQSTTSVVSKSGIKTNLFPPTPSSLSKQATSANRFLSNVSHRSNAKACPSTPSNRPILINDKKMSKTVDTATLRSAKSIKRRSIHFLNNKNEPVTPSTSSRIPLLATKQYPQTDVKVNKKLSPKISPKSSRKSSKRLSMSNFKSHCIILTPNIMQHLFRSATKSAHKKAATPNENVLREEDEEDDIQVTTIKPAYLLKILFSDQTTERNEEEKPSNDLIDQFNKLEDTVNEERAPSQDNSLKTLSVEVETIGTDNQSKQSSQSSSLGCELIKDESNDTDTVQINSIEFKMAANEDVVSVENKIKETTSEMNQVYVNTEHQIVPETEEEPHPVSAKVEQPVEIETKTNMITQPEVRIEYEQVSQDITETDKEVEQITANIELVIEKPTTEAAISQKELIEIQDQTDYNQGNLEKVDSAVIQSAQTAAPVKQDMDIIKVQEDKLVEAESELAINQQAEIRFEKKETVSEFVSISVPEIRVDEAESEPTAEAQVFINNAQQDLKNDELICEEEKSSQTDFNDSIEADSNQGDEQVQISIHMHDEQGKAANEDACERVNEAAMVENNQIEESQIVKSMQTNCNDLIDQEEINLATGIKLPVDENQIVEQLQISEPVVSEEQRPVETVEETPIVTHEIQVPEEEVKPVAKRGRGRANKEIEHEAVEIAPEKTNFVEQPHQVEETEESKPAAKRGRGRGKYKRDVAEEYVVQAEEVESKSEEVQDENVENINPTKAKRGRKPKTVLEQEKIAPGVATGPEKVIEDQNDGRRVLTRAQRAKINQK